MLTEANVEKFNDNGISDFRRRNDSNVSSHPTSSIQPPTEQLGHVEQQQQLRLLLLLPQQPQQLQQRQPTEEEIELKNKKSPRTTRSLHVMSMRQLTNTNTWLMTYRLLQNSCYSMYWTCWQWYEII